MKQSDAKNTATHEAKGVCFELLCFVNGAGRVCSDASCFAYGAGRVCSEAARFVLWSRVPTHTRQFFIASPGFPF